MAWRPTIAAVTPPPPTNFSASAVEKGAALAHLGDCAVCHTASAGQDFAGGLAIKTPFGVVYTSNITPDLDHGIGRWSQAAFVRAMRQGVARDGAHLYPAFPYDHYTLATDGDLADLYAFLMTRKPVASSPPANRLIPPLGFRPVLAGWKLLFLKQGVVAADPRRSLAWNRGRYLVESLAHCGGCHTERNLLGAEEPRRALAGGQAEGWYAPPLDGSSPAVQPWTAERLFTYLRTGFSPSHAAAAGPMGPVVRELSAAPAADVQAIAVYIASRMAPTQARAPGPVVDRAAFAAGAQPQGAALFAGACATCHGPGAPMMLQGRPSLTLGTPLYEPTPRDTVQIILQGLNPPLGRSGPYMPAFADSLSDVQIAQLTAYLRDRYTDHPSWPGNLKAQVEKARKEGGS
jgi:mono/diheme cytochrome c family protein